MVLFLAVVALLASGAEPLAIESRAAWIELNTVYAVEQCKETGQQQIRVTLKQVIFWSGNGHDDCMGWRLADKVTIHEDARGVSAVWHDGDTLRKVQAKFVLESYTLFDREILHRELVAPEFRRGLGWEGERTYRSLRLMKAKEK